MEDGISTSKKKLFVRGGGDNINDNKELRMNHPIVIARAYRGEPLKRVFISQSNGLVYVKNPDCMNGLEAAESLAVGFPAEDIFDFDDQVFGALAHEWQECGATSKETWRRLKRYKA